MPVKGLFMTVGVEEDLEVKEIRSYTVVRHRKKRRRTVLEGKSTMDCNTSGKERGRR
jgi:hypothetical protein